MTQQDVKPLFEDPSASPELRNFVALARSDGPSQADLNRLAERLGPVLGLSAGAALMVGGAGSLGTPPAELAVTPGAPVAGVGEVGLFGKLLGSMGARLMAIGLAAGIGAGLWAWSQRPAPRGAVQLPESAPEAAPAEPGPVLGRGAALAEGLPAAQPAPVHTAPPSEAAPVPQALPTQQPALGMRQVEAAPRHVGNRTRTARVTAATSDVTDSVNEDVAAKHEPMPERAAAPPARPSELSLIQHAESARGRAPEALAALDTHRRLYPDGVLAQEREVLAIELLLKVGQSGQAKARAAQFETRYPNSAHLPRVRALLARADAE